jgi:hypothetical protein
MDEEMPPPPQTAMNSPAGFLNRFFEVGQKRAGPPVEKDGGCFDTIPTDPLHS